MRIMFTSVGRRVELMQAFRNAANKLNIKLEIYGADISESAPALAYCDHTALVPRISNENYIPELIRICQEEKIDALIPTIDTDLLILSQNKDKFGDTKVVISKEDKIKVCRDKRFTADYFNSVGLKSPKPVDDYTKYAEGYPAFIKPKDGSSSIFAYKVENEEELEGYANRVPDYIIQPFIEGTEYTVDIFCDFEGNPILITPRIRLAVRAGEVLKTQIVQDDRIIEEMKQLIADYKPVGQITVQLIRENKSGDDYYLEINPRFGGGAPLTIKAGADSAEMMLRLINGEKLEYINHSAKDGAVFSRFDQSIEVKDAFGKIIQIESLKEVEALTRDNKVIIFDLDDTLFDEKDYVRSGYRSIGRLLCEAKTEEIAKELYDYFESGKPAIDEFFENHKEYASDLKSECINAYRDNNPNISLSQDNIELLKKLRNAGKKIGIITDGRPSGQRKKIKALNLESLVDEIIVTDELAGNGNVLKFRKPNPLAYQIMKERFEVEYDQMVYIGDNKTKDFKAPRLLGMNAIFYNNKNGLYT